MPGLADAIIMRKLALVVLFVSLNAARAEEPTPVQAEYFRTKVRPVLEAACFKCHSHQANKSKGGLVVDSLASLVKGGESGPALVPGEPEKSLLVKAIRHDDEQLKMPPGSKLAAEQTAILVEWVKMGAPWPGASKQAAGHVPGTITEEDRKWWAFQPLRPVTPPGLDDPRWGKNPIDRFVFPRLRAEGLMPAPPADRLALIRRVSFDVIGLPPTPREIDAFLADTSADAYVKLIDRLLASPRYGEKWARHWLDLVRYAESDGYRLDEYRPTAWRYRDYVIRSFNADKPYDRFLREQLAGDELYSDDPDALAGTAFLRHWIYEYNQRDVRLQWQTILDDVTDVTSEAFLGLGMGCARCHDHKFDPILQKDYYRLQAFFAGIQPNDYQPLVTAAERREYERKLDAWRTKAGPILKQIETLTQADRVKAETGAINKFQPEIQAMLRKPEAERTPMEKQLAGLAFRQVAYEFDRVDKKFKDDKTQKIVDLRAELAKFDADKPAPLPFGFAVRDVGPEAPPILIPKKKRGDAIAPGYLTIFDDKPAAIVPGADSTGRRSTLANWLTRPDHPLTARVIVNRVWQQHFGQGLVNTPSDFGRLGEKPSHPELLDWLAQRFVEEGWSFKKLHREILTSMTYRQSALAPASELALKKDPQNRLLWRMTTRRLDAEQIRDAILAVNGRLDLAAEGPSVDAAAPRRTIYTKIFRNSRDLLLDAFDVPETIASAGQRNVTTTPTQALLMINSPFMADQAKAMAARIGLLKSEDERIEAAFRLAFGRRPSDAEKERSLEFVKAQASRVDPKAAVPAFLSAKMPFREGKAALMKPGDSQPHLVAPDGPKLPAGDFTIEAFVLLKSVYDDSRVRPIAAHGNAEAGPGWLFGVTGKKSSHRPQKLVLQMWGENEMGLKDNEAVFSDVQIDLNKPYYVAVAVRVGETGKAGVTFYAKDLSNDEDPLHSFQTPHKIVNMPPRRGPFHVGSGAAKGERSWDGLIDDVRLSNAALRDDQLLLASESVGNQTVAFWQFESAAGPLRDSSSNGLDLTRNITTPPTDPVAAAWADFCQVLLNANEFLYVD